MKVLYSTEATATGGRTGSASTKDGALAEYHLLHAARADYAFRLRDFGKAEKAYLRALELVGNDSERRFLKKRLDEVRERQREGG